MGHSTVQPLMHEASSNDTQTRNESLAKAEIAVQAFIFILAVLGNMSVLLVLNYRKLKTNKMHLFITHLSIADLMVAFFNILPQMAWDITLRFKGSDSLCRFIKFMQIVVIYASTYMLVMTAIDRYIAICKPVNRCYIWTRQRAHTMAIFAWTLSFLLSTPQLAIFKMQPIAVNSSTHDCWATFSPDWTVQLYSTFFSVTVYVLPFIILAVLYGRICFIVCRNLRTEHQRLHKHCGSQNQKVTYKFNGTGHISIIPEHSNENKCQCNMTLNKDICKTKLKTIKLTLVVIIAYVVCWSPFMITQMWWAYDSDAPSNEPVFVMCLLLASLNSCCNPMIYMAFSSTFVCQILPCFSERSMTTNNARHGAQCLHQQANNRRRDSKPKESDSLEDNSRVDQASGTDRRNEATTRTSLTKVTNRLVLQDSLRSQPVLAQIEEGPHEEGIGSRGNIILGDYNPTRKAKFRTITKGRKNEAMKSSSSMPHMAYKQSRDVCVKFTSV